MAEFLLDYLDRTEKIGIPKFIDSYFSKVVRDAFKAEKRDGEIMFRLFKTEDDNIYAVISQGSPYLRIDRRIKYRLENNKWIHKRDFTSNEIKTCKTVVYVIIDSNGDIGRKEE